MTNNCQDHRLKIALQNVKAAIASTSQAIVWAPTDPNYHKDYLELAREMLENWFRDHSTEKE